MARSITWEQLREFAAFRAGRGFAVSLYVGLDPSTVPTAGDLVSHTRSLLASAERQLDERRGTVARDERKALERDLERIADWFGGGFSREGMRGVAVSSPAGGKRQRGTVEVIGVEHRDLEPAGGLAALLRF